jgi:hypothetical protein
MIVGAQVYAVLSEFDRPRGAGLKGSGSVREILHPKVIAIVDRQLDH